MLANFSSSLIEAALSSLAPLQDDLEPTGPVDSDEETEQVMAAIARRRPRPMAQHVHVDLKRRNEVICIKKALHDALPGKGGRGLFAIGETGTTTWNGAAGFADRGAAYVGGGGLSNTVLSNITNGSHEDFEIPSLTSVSREVGSSAWSMREAGRELAAQEKAEEEARKKGGDSGSQGQPVRKSSTAGGSTVVHVEQ